MTELEQYIKDFAADPEHWSNNKRKMRGFPMFRGEANKKRLKHPSVETLVQMAVRVVFKQVPSNLRKTFSIVASIEPIDVMRYIT